MLFPLYHQLEQRDCGPTCLLMIAHHYGIYCNIEELRNTSKYEINKGVSMLGLKLAAKKINLNSIIVELTTQKLIEEAPIPCILHWNLLHFVVLFEIKNRYSTLPKIFEIADPSIGFLTLSKTQFEMEWKQLSNKGKAMIFEAKV